MRPIELVVSKLPSARKRGAGYDANVPGILGALLALRGMVETHEMPARDARKLAKSWVAGLFDDLEEREAASA